MKNEELKIGSSPKSIMITGAAGYVGAMLCHQFSKSSDLEKIIAVDLLPTPAILKDNKKIIWITANLSQNVWRIPALINKPEDVIHCAWQIKELYSKLEKQKKLNIDSSRAVFEFALKKPFVRRLIYFSTISSYGAYFENGLEKFFTEDDELRESESLYGLQKKETEEMLRKMYEESDKTKQIFVLRPSSITGPRGRSIPSKSVGLLNILKNVLPFIPAGSSRWCRQYVHEDDVTDTTAMFTFGPRKNGEVYETYILSPNDLVLASDMAKTFKKPVFYLPPIFIRLAFFLAWHLSDGKIPTGKGAWRFFCYPIVVNGSAITKKYSFGYTYSSHEALASDDGRYATSAEE